MPAGGETTQLGEQVREQGDGQVLHDGGKGDAGKSIEHHDGMRREAGVLPDGVQSGHGGHVQAVDRLEGDDLAAQRLDLGVVTGEEHGTVRGQQDELRPAREVRRDLILRPELEQLAEAGQAGRRDHGQRGMIGRERHPASLGPVAIWQ